MRKSRLTARDASRMLDRPEAHRHDPVGSVLASAALPSHGRVAGEDEALALFRTAPAAAPSRRRRLLAVPAAAAAAVLVLGGGGIAFAASQGAFDVPFTGHDNRSDNAPSAPASTNPGHSATTGKPTTKPSGGSTNAPNGTPTPSLTGLCRAASAHVASGKDIKGNPAFAALVKAAGSNAQVASFCAGLGVDLKEPKPAATPTKKAKPTQAATPTQRSRPSQAADGKPDKAGP